MSLESWHERFFAGYWDWCCAVLAADAAADFPRLFWIRDISVRIVKAYAEQVAGDSLGDVLQALLAERFRTTFGFAPPAAAEIDVTGFPQFKRTFLDRLFMDVTFSRELAERTQNRKRDRKFAREIQKSLMSAGWQSFRATPSEMGASCVLAPGACLRLWLVLPHGSLEYYFDLTVADRLFLRRESFLGWVGIGGDTSVWSDYSDGESIQDAIIEDCENFLDFLRPQEFGAGAQ